MTRSAEERSRRVQRRQGTLGLRVLNSGWQVRSVVMLLLNDYEDVAVTSRDVRHALEDVGRRTYLRK